MAICAAIGLSTIAVGLAAQPESARTPTETFKAYRAALAKATSYADILPFMEAKGRAMVEAVPEPQRASMFGYLKKFEAVYTDVAVTRETITGDSAVLDLSGKDSMGQPATGSVPLTKETSGWKIGTEKWSSKPRGSD